MKTLGSANAGILCRMQSAVVSQQNQLVIELTNCFLHLLLTNYFSVQGFNNILVQYIVPFSMKNGPESKRHISISSKDTACPAELLQHFVIYMWCNSLRDQIAIPAPMFSEGCEYMPSVTKVYHKHKQSHAISKE